MNHKDIPQAGIITTNSYIYTPDGDQQRGFFCRNWLIVTTKEAGLADIKSSDKWAAVALVNGKVALIIPGCQVMGYAVCKVAPSINCYHIK